jgi:hypothetical protein
MNAQANFTKIAKATVVAAVLSGFLLFAGTPTVQASEESDCRERIVKADHRLHEEATKHGWDSPQAAEKRRDLTAARERCWEHGHRWWDEDGQRWHTERDWDVDHEHHY